MNKIGKIRRTDAIAFLESLDSNSAGAMITDPPSYLTIDLPDSDQTDIDDTVDWMTPLARHTKRVLRPGGSSVVIGKGRPMSAWEVAATRAGLRWIADITILWDTDNKAESVASVARWHAKPGLRKMGERRREAASNVIVCRDIPMRDRVCASQKPVELTNFFISMLTRRRDLIVDPFCGSGGTLVSAEMCGRKWAGADTDEEMVREARRRVQQTELETADLDTIYYWNQHTLTEI